MGTPLVSVVIPSYNHASFVRGAIESVLTQRDVPFEVVIGDDGSTDGTRDVIAAIRDDRIRFFPNSVNRGACLVTNELIDLSRGEFIALLNSDDRWATSDKLALQVEMLRAHPDIAATFGRARFVDRDGRPIVKDSLPFGAVFDQGNRSQGAWLRRFFDLGNCLCHPTILIRRRCYKELGSYSNQLRQLPDFDMWVRLIKRYPLHVAEQELVEFRYLQGDNASAITPSNSIRTMNEHYLVADRFFDGASRALMIEGFGDTLKINDIPTSRHLDIEKALQFLRPNQWLFRPYQLIGMLKLRGLLESAAHRQVMLADYKIDDSWFHRKMAEVDVLRPGLTAVLGASKVEIKGFWTKIYRRLFRGNF